MIPIHKSRTAKQIIYIRAETICIVHSQ